MTTRLVLPLPPTLNHAYRNYTTPEGRRMRVLSRSSLAFQAHAGWLAKIWVQKERWHPPEGKKIIVRIWYYWPDRRRRDQDNPQKLLLDAMTGILWSDDRWALPRVIDYAVDREKPRVEIELEEVSEDA